MSARMHLSFTLSSTQLLYPRRQVLYRKEKSAKRCSIVGGVHRKSRKLITMGDGLWEVRQTALSNAINSASERAFTLTKYSAPGLWTETRLRYHYGPEWNQADIGDRDELYRGKVEIDWRKTSKIASELKGAIVDHNSLTKLEELANVVESAVAWAVELSRSHEHVAAWSTDGRGPLLCGGFYTGPASAQALAELVNGTIHGAIQAYTRGHSVEVHNLVEKAHNLIDEYLNEWAEPLEYNRIWQKEVIELGNWLYLQDSVSFEHLVQKADDFGKNRCSDKYTPGAAWYLAHAAISVGAREVRGGNPNVFTVREDGMGACVIAGLTTDTRMYKYAFPRLILRGNQVLIANSDRCLALTGFERMRGTAEARWVQFDLLPEHISGCASVRFLPLVGPRSSGTWTYEQLIGLGKMISGEIYCSPGEDSRTFLTKLQGVAGDSAVELLTKGTHSLLVTDWRARADVEKALQRIAAEALTAIERGGLNFLIPAQLTLRRKSIEVSIMTGPDATQVRFRREGHSSFVDLGCLTKERMISVLEKEEPSLKYLLLSLAEMSRFRQAAVPGSFEFAKDTLEVMEWEPLPYPGPKIRLVEPPKA